MPLPRLVQLNTAVWTGSPVPAGGWESLYLPEPCLALAGPWDRLWLHYTATRQHAYIIIRFLYFRQSPC